MKKHALKNFAALMTSVFIALNMGTGVMAFTSYAENETTAESLESTAASTAYTVVPDTNADYTEDEITTYEEDDSAYEYTSTTAPDSIVSETTSTTTTTPERTRLSIESTTTKLYDYTNIPLSGTFSLKISLIDIFTGENFEGLDCVLYIEDTEEEVASWNTSDTEEFYIENLEYSFDSSKERGNIVYALKIENLPENRSFTDSYKKDYTRIAGYSLDDFAETTDLEITEYIDEVEPHTYVTSGTIHTTTRAVIPTEIATEEPDSTEPETTTTPERTRISTSYTTTEVYDFTDVPLSGTYSLKIKLVDIFTGENFEGLDCVLYNEDTGEAAASWNTSDAEEFYIEDLEYSFDDANYPYKGNIVYVLKVENMPENRYFLDIYDDSVRISGYYLGDFVETNELEITKYIDEAEPATEPSEEISSETSSTEYVSDDSSTAPMHNYFQCGDVNVDNVINVADVILLNKYIVGAGTISSIGLVNAECYADGQIDINDSAQIMNVVVMTISEKDLPVIP